MMPSLIGIARLVHLRDVSRHTLSPNDHPPTSQITDAQRPSRAPKTSEPGGDRPEGSAGGFRSRDGQEAANPHRSVRWLARFLVQIFYRKIEVVGLEHVPHDRPLVFVANHVNSLVDPALVLAFMPTLPRPLATSELWRIPILKPFLRWGAAIPVYRRHVEGFDRTKNLATFARCHEVLAAGGAIVILPEGTSHNQPALVPLRTGVSRIVLQAMTRYGDLGIRIVPVGFTFEDRTRFRSDVLIEVGPAIDPAAEFEIYQSQTRQAIKTLTERIREALVELTLNFPSWEEADLIQRAAEIYQQPSPGAPPPASLSRRVELRRVFTSAYQALRRERPRKVDEVTEAVRRYGGELRRQGLRDELVAAKYRPQEIVRFTTRSLWLLLIRLPLGLVGMVINVLPFQGAALAARRLTEDDDRTATYKVLASMVFYPLTWLLLAVAAGWTWGLGIGLLTLVLGPLTGGVALRLYLRSTLFWERARAFVLMRSGKPRVARLRRLRREAIEAIERLVELYRRGGAVD